MSKKILSAFLVSLITFGCSVPGLAGSFSKKAFSPISSSDKKSLENSKISQVNNSFALKLYQELIKEKKGKNLFISPLSIFFALSMTYNGANGETAKKMAETLDTKDFTKEELNQSANLLLRYLINTDKDVSLEIANSLWPKKGFGINQTFLKNNTDFYKATVQNLDYSSKEAENTINDWVSTNTGKKIEKIVENLDPETLMVLVNAIYFKGNWSEKFSKEDTKNKNFTLSNGETIQHPLMEQNGKYLYLKNEKFQAITLPYGKSEKIGMSIFLPSKESSLDKFYADLNNENLNKWFGEFRKKQGQIIMPKFKIEDEAQLKQPLSAIGMSLAFDQEKADFTKMFNPPDNGYIEKVVHKSFINVNEEGTEAAAATAVVIMPTSAAPDPEPPFEMIVDRPFVFMIRDQETGTILFIGSMEKPSL